MCPLVPYSIHLNVNIPPGSLASKPPLHAQLNLSKPLPQPNKPVHKDKDNHDAHRNPHHIRSNTPPSPNGIMVQKSISIPPLRRHREVRNAQVPQQYGNQPQQMNPGGSLRPRKHNLEERKRRVQRVLRDIVPGVKLVREPDALVQQGPVHDCDEKRQRHDCGVEERVEGLQGPREGLEEGSLADRVGECVEGRGEKVEGDAPVCKDGEVGEGAADGSAAAEGGVRAGVGYDEEEGCECVERLFSMLVFVFPLSCSLQVRSLVRHLRRKKGRQKKKRTYNQRPKPE